MKSYAFLALILSLLGCSHASNQKSDQSVAELAAYKGLGTESVSASDLEKFKAPALDLQLR